MTDRATASGGASRVRAVPVPGRARGQLGHPLDGRYGAMRPEALEREVENLRTMTPLSGVRYVLGIPEGGTAPALTFARQAGLPHGGSPP